MRPLLGARKGPVHRVSPFHPSCICPYLTLYCTESTSAFLYTHKCVPGSSQTRNFNKISAYFFFSLQAPPPPPPPPSQPAAPAAVEESEEQPEDKPMAPVPAPAPAPVAAPPPPPAPKPVEAVTKQVGARTHFSTPFTFYIRNFWIAPQRFARRCYASPIRFKTATLSMHLCQFPKHGLLNSFI